MDTPATLGNLWVVIGIFAGALISLAGWVWLNLKSKASATSNERLWASHNEQSREFSRALTEFRVTVAREYVTAQQLAAMRGDLERHIDRQFADLQKAVESLRSELREERRQRALPAE